MAIAALAVLALGVGIAIWMGVRGEVQRSAAPGDGRRSTPTSSWSFSDVEVDDVCGPGAKETVLESLEPRAEPLPLRLSDHLLVSSPIAKYGLAFDGPVSDYTRPWQQALAAQGALEGYARTFNSTTMAGGFTMFAYELPSATAATIGAGSAYRTFVCEFGAQPLTVDDQPAIIAGVRPSDSAQAWWVHGPRVIEVNYALYGDLKRDLASALLVLEAAWDSGV